MTTPTFPINFYHSANPLFSTRWAGITINNPDTFLGTGAWRHISGTDAITGFSHTDLAAAPLYVRPPGGGITGNGGYGIYMSQTGGFSSNDLTGTEAACPVSAPAAVSVRGASTNEFYMHFPDTGPANTFAKQSWITFYRDLSVAGDLQKLCVRQWIKLQDFSTLLSASNRNHVFFDCKTGTLALGGDQRYKVGLVYANSATWYDEGVDIDGTAITPGKIGFVCVSDSRANGTGITDETFFTIKNFSVPVPVNEYFQLEVYWQRSASYTDVNTGRIRVVMRKLDGTEYVLFDITKSFIDRWNAAYPTMPVARNIHMGSRGDKWQRLFLSGIYFGGDANKDVGIRNAGIDIFDDIPYYLPAAA